MTIKATGVPSSKTRVRVTDGCELTNMHGKNLTQLLCKGSFDLFFDLNL